MTLDVKKLQEQFSAFYDNKPEELALSEQCRRFESGDQWTAEQRANLAERGQAPSVYNYVRRKIGGLVGIEEQTRRDPKAYGRNSGIDEKSAEVATSIIRYVADNNNLAYIGARVLRDGELSGFGGVRFGVNFVAGFPEIQIERIDPRYTGYDPRSEALDFSDASYFFLSRYLSKDSMREMFAGDTNALNIIDNLGVDTYADYDGFDRRNNIMITRLDGMHYLIEHHYYDKGEWRVAHWSGDSVLRDVPSIVKDETGKTAPQLVLWGPYIDDDNVRFGDAKDMLDPQMGINKKISKILHLISSNQTIGEDGFTDDVDEFKRQKALPNGHMTVNHGMRGAVEFVNNQAEIASLVSLLQLEMSEMDRTGPNNALVGRGTEQQSGVAIQEQKASGLAEVSPAMQEFRLWKLRVYRTIWNAVKAHWTREKVIRITEDDDAPKYIGLNQIRVDRDENGVSQLVWDNQIAQIDVDIILDEGPDTVTLNQQDFSDLMQMAPALANTESAIPPEVLLKASRLRNKDKLVEMIDQRKKAAQESQGADDAVAQMQQQKMQLDLEEQAAKTTKMKAEAEKINAQAAQARWEIERDRALFEAQRDLVTTPVATPTIQ